jgi:hypothetical protein
VAKVKNPLFSLEASGKVGGLVFMGGARSGVVRANSIGVVNPVHMPEDKYVEWLILWILWHKLTPAQRHLWYDFDLLYPQHIWTTHPKGNHGWYAFSAVNNRLKFYGRDTLTYPPTIPPPHPPTEIGLYWNETEFEWYISHPFGDNHLHYFEYAYSVSSSRGRKPDLYHRKYCGYACEDEGYLRAEFIRSYRRYRIFMACLDLASGLVSPPAVIDYWVHYDIAVPP